MFIDTRDYEMRLYWERRLRDAEKRSLRNDFKAKIFSRIKAYGEPRTTESDPKCRRMLWSKFGAHIQKPERRWVWFEDRVVLDQFSEDELLKILEGRARNNVEVL